MKRNRRYTSRLQKGGALLDDMRLLVRTWSNGSDIDQCDRIVAQNMLGKESRARAVDTLHYAFLPRFVHGTPENAWTIVRPLEDRDVAIDVLKPLYYWITARSEPILYDFVCEELRRYEMLQAVPTRDVVQWVEKATSKTGKLWSRSVNQKVAQGILAALRDFGILEGRAKKRLADTYLPIESFAYLAFVLHESDATSQQLLHHRDWNLFRLGAPLVERMFLEADREGLLGYHAAGDIIRVDFPAHNYEEMADVVARTARE